MFRALPKPEQSAREDRPKRNTRGNIRRSSDQQDHTDFSRRTPSRSTSLLSVANQPLPRISLQREDSVEDSAQAQMHHLPSPSAGPRPDPELEPDSGLQTMESLEEEINNIKN